MAQAPEFEHSFQALPKTFFHHCSPTSVASPQFVHTNYPLAQELGIDQRWLASTDALALFSGNLGHASLSNSNVIATAYTGHQFGHLNPRLGDGRAHLLGELLTTNGQRFDVQLKGSGTSIYSRQGDGRSPLGPVLREYLVSEAMAALSIPTTRSLAAVTTGEGVRREQGIQSGGILTRVASSHIRVGSFTYAALQDRESNAVQPLSGNIAALADYCLDRHFKDRKPHAIAYWNLLDGVIDRQAELIARWMSVGFIHGVMNTDNMLICGETVDYGPCAFMDAYDPKTVYSYIDRQGRYRYENQPAIGQWNLVRLAEALLPVMGRSEASIEAVQTCLNGFQDRYEKAYSLQMMNKLGFVSANAASIELCNSLLALMKTGSLDYTLTFRYLMHHLDPHMIRIPSTGYAPTDSLKQWINTWLNCVTDREQALAIMMQNNPIYIPRNHHVEAAIAAGYQGNYALFRKLLDLCTKPYDWVEGEDTYAIGPQAHEMVTHTFCGT